MNETIKKRIENDIKNNKIMLYMKGTPDFPQCGFSARVVDILRKHNAKFHSCNILEDEAVRQGVKEYADWPTIPQLYVDGEFIGGCDILTELHESGELKEILNRN